MHAKSKDLVALLQLQHFDLETLRSQKALDALPQRKEILKIREVKKGIEAKKAQVEDMHKSVNLDFLRINDEDERLTAKQEKAQAKINEARGDYRLVDAHTKELGGIAKRRNTLESQLGQLSEKLAQIDQVKKQVDDALQLLEKQEAEFIDSFKIEGGKLTRKLAQLKANRTETAGNIPADLLTLYEQKLKRGEGIAVARLKEEACGVCRNKIDEGKLLQIKAEAPLSVCPYCKRMLVLVDV